jgi:hypothetical protein
MTVRWLGNLIVCLGLIMSWSALSHSPHLGPDEAAWTAPDGRRLTLAMLYGDGIIAADPGRPVVLDEAKRIIALGPLAYDGTIKCERDGVCKVLLGRSSSVDAVTPDPAGFRAPLMELPYPEYEKDEYGFQPTRSTFDDEWFRWTTAYRQAPIVSLFFTFLFACFAYWAGAWPLRVARALKPRTGKSVVRCLFWWSDRPLQCCCQSSQRPCFSSFTSGTGAPS